MREGVIVDKRKGKTIVAKGDVDNVDNEVEVVDDDDDEEEEEDEGDEEIGKAL